MENLPAVNPQRGGLDERGLTDRQRQFMLEIAAGKTRKEAAKSIDISPSTVTTWQRQPAFRQALSEVFDGAIAETRIRMAGATATAMDGLIEAMEAMKDADLELTCPSCGDQISVKARVPNWTARVKAQELVLRAAKILKDVREVEGSIVSMTIEQKIAMALYKAGKLDQIPAHMWGDLQKLGIIPADEQPPIIGRYEVME